MRTSAPHPMRDKQAVLINVAGVVRGGMIVMIKYEMIIYWSDEDEAFIVEVPELPGCMADGPTYQKAVANAYTIVQEWIETAKELGRSIPEPKGRLVYA